MADLCARRVHVEAAGSIARQDRSTWSGLRDTSGVVVPGTLPESLCDYIYTVHVGTSWSWKVSSTVLPLAAS